MDAQAALLHDAAKANIGDLDLNEHLSKKPTNYVAAVVWHNVDEQAPSQSEQYVWIKGNSKVTIGKVKEVYASSSRLPQAWSLRAGSHTLSDNLTLPEVDYFHDRFVVLRVVNPGLDGSRLHSNPPEPLIPGETFHLSASPEASVPSTHSRQSEMVESVLDTPTIPCQPTNAQSNCAIRVELSASPDHVGGDHPSHYSCIDKFPKNELQELYHHHHHPPPQSDKLQDLMPTVSSKDSQRRETPGSGLEQDSHPPDEETNRPVLAQHPEPSPHLFPLVKHELYGSESAAFQASDKDSDQDDHLAQPAPSNYLQDLTKSTAPEKLEAGVTRGIQLLTDLQAVLSTVPETNGNCSWNASIEALRTETVSARTVVGVVGSTGAGKSSVINAIIDEERLVPTNCMRACTAVVTEMSWNNSNDESAKYRAEVEFIQSEDWENELKVLFKEILDGNGKILTEVYTPDSEASKSYAKIRAVYYKHSRDDLVASSIEKLMHEEHVRKVLGTTQSIAESSSEGFYKCLQRFVDSKERVGTTIEARKDEEKQNRKREMEFWPLIKVVRMFVKSDALSTGAVIVDLPGIQDSNAARATVAEGYIKQCTGLWIVAPITRAVDDKAAKTLLGNSFKRQLKYDGNFSAVTFICSKTDDISNTEAVDSLGLGDDMGCLDNELSLVEGERKDVEEYVSQLMNKKTEYGDVIDTAEEQIDQWEQLQEDVDAGNTTYPSGIGSKKRKRFPNGNEETPSSGNGETPSSIQDNPLTEVDVERKLTELKTAKREARRNRIKLDDQIKQLSLRINELETKSEMIEARRSALCIAGRNLYSKAVIQADFAIGIKELDQENQDPEAFNPDEDARDYEEVAKSLPVFCVSSRAYQKMSGRLVKDHAVRGFTSLQQTGIPALQEHCKRITEGTRVANCRRFLNSLSQLRTSMSLWASDDGRGDTSTKAERSFERSVLARELRELELAFASCIKETMVSVQSALKKYIFDHYSHAVTSASEAALQTSIKWGSNRDDGGLLYSTYKATTRRAGSYYGAHGARDFNAELTEPIFKHLAKGWEKAFQRHLPTAFKTLATKLSRILRSFHQEIEKRSREYSGANACSYGALVPQLAAYEAAFADLANDVINLMSEQQKEANREFAPTVRKTMKVAYELCANERGIGSFLRMKDHMSSGVAANKDIMFQSAAQLVQDKLNAACNRVQGVMEEKTEVVLEQMRRDYHSVLGDINSNEGGILSEEERAIRMRVEEIVRESEGSFQTMFEGDGKQ